MKVTCYIKNKKLTSFTWDKLPNVGMGFDFEGREYMIIKIDDSKITVKDITKGAIKQHD